MENDRLINSFINHRIPTDLTKYRTINSEAYFNDHDYTNGTEFEMMKIINEVSLVEIKSIEKIQLNNRSVKFGKIYDEVELPLLLQVILLRR